MSTKNDWDAAADRAAAAERAKLGDPPTPQEVVGFMEGTLPPAEMERVRRLLTYYPELADVVVESDDVPTERVLTDAELEHDRARLHARIGRRPAVTWWQSVQRMAAMILIAVSTVLTLALVQSRRAIDRLESEAHQPRVISRHVLDPQQNRSTRSPQRGYELPADATTYLLAPALIDPPPFTEYRVDLVDLNGEEAKTVWSRRGTQRDPADSLEIVIPRAFLDGTHYRLDVYGTIDSKPQLLGSFRLHRSR